MLLNREVKGQKGQKGQYQQTHFHKEDDIMFDAEDGFNYFTDREIELFFTCLLERLYQKEKYKRKRLWDEANKLFERLLNQFPDYLDIFEALEEIRVNGRTDYCEDSDLTESNLEELLAEIQNSMAYKDYIVSLYTYNNYRETFKNRWNVGIWNELRRKTYLTDAGEWEKGSVLKTVEELRE